MGTTTSRARNRAPIRRVAFAGIVALSAFAPLAPLESAAQADESRFGPNDVRTVFAIGKNLDRNEVQYGVRLDNQCRPESNEPVYAYWRQFEQGPNVTEDLNFLDKTAYGIKSQSIQLQTDRGTKIVMTLRATSERGIAVVVRKDGATCTAEALAFINNTPARLTRVYVHVAGFLSVDYIELIGTRLDNGKPVVERIQH